MHQLTFLKVSKLLSNKKESHFCVPSHIHLSISIGALWVYSYYYLAGWCCLHWVWIVHYDLVILDIRLWFIKEQRQEERFTFTAIRDQIIATAEKHFRQNGGRFLFVFYGNPFCNSPSYRTIILHVSMLFASNISKLQSESLCSYVHVNSQLLVLFIPTLKWPWRMDKLSG